MYKPLDSRQVINHLALSNIGSPANDSLDDILNKINAALGGASSGPGYIAKSVPLTSGTNSFVITIPAQPDLSYVVFPILENLVDLNPQFQEVEITNKTLTGFTASINAPLDSSNYSLTYVIPLRSSPGTETPISNGVASQVINLNIPQNGPAYSIVGMLQNTVDTTPEFQTAIVTTQTGTSFTEKTNAPTDSSNYRLVWIAAPTAQIGVGSGVTSITATLPTAYGSTNYAVIPVLSDVTDSTPKFQPLVITNKTSTTFTVSINTVTDTANYILTYLAISLTP